MIRSKNKAIKDVTLKLTYVMYEINLLLCVLILFTKKPFSGGNSTLAPSSGLCHQETYLQTTLKVLLGCVKISKNFSLYINYLFSVHPQLRDGLWQPPVLGTQQSRPPGYTMCVHNSPSRYIFWKLIIFPSIDLTQNKNRF